MTSRPDLERRAALPLYLTGEHECSYIAGLSARTLFVDPLQRVDSGTYQLLLERGFRRSGGHIYRPGCDRCHRCVSLRIPVRAFMPTRSQRRNREQNGRDLVLTSRPPAFEPEHYRLYYAYLQNRHPDGSMADASPASYSDFLVTAWGGETRFLELRLEARLVAVAVTDLLPGALSAVYTFFDPQLSHRAPGTYAILCQIEEARRLGLDYLYLGYWIEECRKMSYKDGYRPTEAWLDGSWRRFAKGETIPWRAQNDPAEKAS
ncbi:MAG: arginyltransferase [Chromatiaceae bacterium]|jgi:leucyl-tRNA---protein transferase